MAGKLEIVTVAEGTESHPRHGGADMIGLRDGSLLMIRMIIYSSSLRNQAGDDAPSDLVRQSSRDGGRTWTRPELVIERGPANTAAYSPHLVRLRDGSILFCYEMYHHFVQNEPMSISGLSCTSRDECRSFSAPRPIWSKSPAHGGSQNDMILMSTGRIVLPVCRMTSGTALQDDGKGLAPANTWEAGCFYSDDSGATWKECEKYVCLPMRGAMEPKIEELKDGRLLMVMRTQLGSVFKSVSADGGQSWSNAQTTGLKSPESCPGLRRIPQTGDLLIVWNNSPYDPKFDHYGVRSPFTVAVSSDEGRTWGRFKNIEADPAWEYTNPSILVTKDAKVMISYEASKYETLVPPGRLGRSRMHLRLAIVDVDWLYA